MQPHRLFNKALLAIAIAGVLSATIVLVPDSISDSFSAYAKDGGGAAAMAVAAVATVTTSAANRVTITAGAE
ncbi:hypothetical protein [Pseudomonas sp.]|uniref:hypothetical protein n=1 Tax=Pseudomonas sp. TaxID=306 RepID=UPI003D0B19AB